MFLVCITIVGCKRNKSMMGEEVKINYLPLKETYSVDNLVPFIDSISCIIPEQIIPSPLNKMLIDDDNNMYLLGFSGDLVTLTQNGKKFKHFSSKGKARNEYIKINDIALRRHPKELIILDEIKVMSIGIDDTLSFKTFNTPNEIPFDAVAPSGEKRFYLFSAFPKNSEDISKSSDCLLKLVNEDGDVIKEMVKREDCTFSIANITQSFDNEYYLRPQNNSHIFYKLGSDTLIPQYKVDFENENIPSRYYFDVANDNIVEYMHSPYFKLPSFAYETKNCFYFKCVGANAIVYNFLFDKTQSKKGIRWIKGDDDPNFNIMGSDENYFYILFNKYQADRYDESKKHGPLYRYIMQAIDYGKVFKDTDEIILKIAFSIK